MSKQTAKTDRLRYRPCTHLIHRPATRGDKDAAGKAVPRGHAVIVNLSKCHIEDDGTPNPEGAEIIPLTYLSPTEMRGSVTGKLACLFAIRDGRVYRASLGNGDPQPAPPHAHDYEAMKTTDLLAIRNELHNRTTAKWGGTRKALINEIQAASN